MNKKGFTLQELLVTLGIVGIVAALTAPAINALFPDQTKMKYMKAYNTLTNTTSEIISDSSLYWPVYDENTGALEEDGLYNYNRPQVSPYSLDENCDSETKFACIFSKNVNLQGEPVYDSGKTTLITTDGTSWTFDVEEVNDGRWAASLGYQINITINTDPSDNTVSHNCIFDNNNCKKPNQFAFVVENDGGVFAADALGMAYLSNSTDMHSGSLDRDLAKEIYEAAGSKISDYKALQTAYNTIISKKQSSTKK